MACHFLGMDLTTVNELRSSVLSLQEHIEAMIEMLAHNIKEEAHADGNMPWLQECAKKVEVLKGDLRELATIQEHAVEILTNNLSFDSDGTEVSATGLRRMSIEVSRGMLNQHLLTLTDAVQRGLVRNGEQFTIQLPDETTFVTELCNPGNKLRERGQIRRFYQEAKIQPGDKVVMIEVSRGTWSLRRAAMEEGLFLADRLMNDAGGSPTQTSHAQTGIPPQKP
jgi:hypothetical protein